MINHQLMPYLFNLSIIKPLIKDPKKSSDDISKFRPVAVSESLANLFEAILLKEVSKYHRDDELQFGFKAKSSCAHAIFTLQQTIKNSMDLGKWAYITAIEASKAYDKIDRNILWQKLITAKIHPAIIRRNFVKNLLGIPSRLSEYFLINMKIDFYSRLIEKSFTKKLIIELAKQPASGDYNEEILEITKDVGTENMTLLDKCKMRKDENLIRNKAGKNDEKVHKAKQQFRKCTSDGCEVKYNLVICEVKNICSISQKNSHNHEILPQYNNENGLPDKLKQAIIELINNNPKLNPRQIRCHLNNNRVKYGIKNLELKNSQIAGFVYRYKTKLNPKQNKVEDVENFLVNNLYFPTIEPNTPFFFGFPIKDYRPVLGNGSDFKLYFESQWLEGQWVNWPLFTRPAGFSTTNNNTEGFNKTIKKIYTNYERSTILEGCNVIKRMVIDLSLSQVKFDLAIQRKKSIVKEAEVLNLSYFLIIDWITAYRVVNGQNKYYVLLNPRYCRCINFLEYGICKHCIALCGLLNYPLDENVREFVHIKKKGRPAKSNNGALNKN
ncbi:unnamed protein product [Brachionus calyciflorus]|uniref:SWIM-type domain-containing protein n=1 Tax=Brachionus calyciflorus TaxID=104777 RepID=A0A813M8K5_9BILA|nr:unnamed protein product [Brachionus calyciflorus]